MGCAGVSGIYLSLHGIFSSPHDRQSLDSGFPALESGFQYWNRDSLPVKLGFRIPIVSGIPVSLS